MAPGSSAMVDAWYNGAWWLWLLRPLEFFFRSVACVRRTFYRVGLFKRYLPETPLVIVGNITVGGTGKTPIVLALVEYLQSIGLNPGVVSRGYGATGTTFPHKVGDKSTAADCGDEALLVFLRTGCPCVVAPKRIDAVKALLKSAPVDLIISDDGLQHYALDRHMEIAVLDADRRVGNGFCLPAGPLREPQSRLKEVDYVLYRGSTDPIQGVTYTPMSLVNIATGNECAVSPGSMATEVYAVAGIGQPQQFFDSLLEAGFNIEPQTFSDHHLFIAKDFSKLSGKPIIMTEKDAVKCKHFADKSFWYLKIQAQLPDALLRSVAALDKNDLRKSD